MRSPLLPVLAALALLSCSVRSRICGREGEACCPSGVICESGLACDAANVCSACTTCTVGTQRCTAGGGIEHCLPTATAGCRGWSVIVEQCPDGQTCRAQGDLAACGAGCPEACVVDAVQCSTEGRVVCVGGGQGSCPTFQPVPAEDDGTCLAGVCTEGFCWERPTPQGNHLVGVVASVGGRVLVLDNMGNILRRNGATTTYEFRRRQGPAPLALGSCRGLTFAVGNRGLVLRAVAGWASESVGDTTARLNAVACGVTTATVAVGSEGKLFLRRSDATWRAVPTGISAELTGVAILSFDETVYAVSEGGDILRCPLTADPEQTVCTAESFVSPVPLSAVWAHPMKNEVFAVGSQGQVLRRGPGGWAVEPVPGLTQGLTALQGDDTGTLRVAGYGGAFAKRAPDGTWSVGPSLPDDVSGLAVSEEGTVLATTVPGGLSTLDGGVWVPEADRSEHVQDINAVSGTNARNVWVVGADGFIHHKQGDVWLQEGAGVTSEILLGVTAVSTTEAYAVGTRGTVLARHDGRWAVEAAGLTTKHLMAVWNDGVRVYATGVDGTWLERPVGAAGTWELIPQSLTLGTLSSVWGLRVGTGPAPEVWATGGNCLLMKKTAAGFALEPLPLCQDQVLQAVAESAGGELYVVGENLVLRRPAGSTTWEKESVSSLSLLLSVAVEGSEVWAGSHAGELFHRVGGEWRLEAPGMLAASNISGVWAIPGGGAYFVGSSAIVRRD